MPNPGLHLAVDAHRLICEPLTSGATYLSTLVSEWLKEATPPQIDLLFPREPDAEFRERPSYKHPKVRLIYPEQALDPIEAFRAQVAWQQITIAKLLRKSQPDVYLSPFHLTPQRPHGVKMVTTIHDLCFLCEPAFSVGSMVHRGQLWSACLRAQRLICVSQFTLQTLARWWPRMASKAKVVSNGLDGKTLKIEEAWSRVSALGRRNTCFG
jgi:hypothetical protein